MQETFKDIPNYEGLYQISNLGRVKSLRRKHFIKRNNCFGIKKERMLKISFDSSGYLKATLCKNGKCRPFLIHQLLAITFLNHTLCGHKLVVDHINNIKTDNRLENLQIITHRQNISKDKRGTSRFTGVSYSNHFKKWISKIYIINKEKHLGYYNCETAAHLAYQRELQRL